MNKPSRPLLVGPLLQSFFSEHLCSHKDASIQTIASYRDTFRLLLSYVQQTAGIEPSALRITDLEVTVILAFLAHLEQQRHNSVRSRNIRLAAIRSFFRLVALRDPDSVGLVTQVLAIPIKRSDKPLVGFQFFPMTNSRHQLDPQQIRDQKWRCFDLGCRRGWYRAAHRIYSPR
jgi:site-specific recombinase XerD